MHERDPRGGRAVRLPGTAAAPAAGAGKAMSLLIDGRPLQTYSATRGIGRYVEQIARTFAEDERARFLLFRGPGSAAAPRPVVIPSPRRMITWTDAFYLPRAFSRSGTTCYHSTAFGLPPRI